ncbi:MAG TPA: phosphotransferase [Candidatus Coprenecus stercoravium]|uniref:Phosphotransferase n=1 Tax=Candidatus Coprenecus stercoravium TaxID=2840735 RepID=A0A9D2GMP3_9BACT|nr:phosphotransferase [Candidatus Coprenecus stercoravium]
MEKIRRLFEEYSDVREYGILPLPSSGGDRRYYRIRWSKGSCIAAYGTDIKENSAFLYMADHFHNAGLPVPEIFAVSRDRLCYLQEDLGDTTLFNAVSSGRDKGIYSDGEISLLRRAVEALPSFQFKGAEGMDFSMCAPVSRFDRTSVMFDLNYFKYCFLKPSGLEFDETALENDFDRMCGKLLACCGDTFMYRDFQSRNIMVLPDGSLRFIDFQGGRKGPVHYDLVSFIWQARARYSPELKNELTEAYLDALSEYTDIDREKFNAELRHFALFRTLQTLGAYGFRGMYERRPHFIESIPYAMDNIAGLLSEPFDEYPCLSDVLLRLVPIFRHKDTHNDGKLHIRIFSFSYKNGIPEDSSGNGGGYVFDCRGLPNPGRLPEYRCLTGLDGPVVEYLSKFPETETFAGHTAALADMHIGNYLDRGFSDLMFSFGCTGGRHRSVYFAEKLTEHIRNRYGDRLAISLCHREQDIRKTF